MSVYQLKYKQREAILEKHQAIAFGLPYEYYLKQESHKYFAPCTRLAFWNKKDNYYIPSRCKCWTCEDCAPEKAQALRERFRYGEIAYWDNKWHIILTIADWGLNPIINECFNDAITYIMRGFYYEILNDDCTILGRKIKAKKRVLVDKDEAEARIARGDKNIKLVKRPNLQYAWVKEFQGERFQIEGEWYRHLHVIINQHMSKYDWIPIWNHVTKREFNYVEDRKVYKWDNGGYLSKYLTKFEYQEHFMYKEHRYGCSKGVLDIPKKNKKKSENWIPMYIEYARELYIAYRKNPATFQFKYDLEVYRFVRGSGHTFTNNYAGWIRSHENVPELLNI